MHSGPIRFLALGVRELSENVSFDGVRADVHSTTFRKFEPKILGRHRTQLETPALTRIRGWTGRNDESVRGVTVIDWSAM